ncbi:MAG: hypothetical protein IJ408_04635 [Clostridia bacterium]|nr:hypothetical protein [Clostridia bacterium]
MKKIIIWTAILSIIISVCGCKSAQNEEQAFAQNPGTAQNEQAPEVPTDTESDEKEPEPKPETEKNEQTAPESEPEKEQAIQSNKPSDSTVQEETVPDYKALKCKSIAGWQTVRMSGKDGVSIQFDIPSDWVLTKSAEKYNIACGGKQIGSIVCGTLAAPKDKFEYKSGYNEEKELVSFRQVSWYKSSNEDSIYRDFQFVSDQGGGNFTLSIQVDYEQLDSSASDKLYSSAFTVPVFVNTEFVPISKCNGSKKILILGNSFIGTSQVGAFLNDMVRSEGLTVNAISRGHAKISDYVADSAICNSIRSGEYCYVFISGFYGAAENVEHFGTLLDICKKSNTQLVLFPFHNDTVSYIDQTKVKYTESIFLDWKGEINSLISSGMVTKSDMCQNDEYGHSTHLAGYVGAHMIYRNMFGKVPPEITSSPLSMSAVRSKLGSYVDSYEKPQSSSPADFTGKTYTI